MSWNPFDFNNDGSVDPAETFIAGEIAFGIGYGAGSSEADERIEQLRNEYDEELERRKRRNDELEDELDGLREERDSWWYDDEDDYDFDDDDDGDEYSGSRGGLEKYFYDNYRHFDYAEYVLDHPGEDTEDVMLDVIEIKRNKGITD